MNDNTRPPARAAPAGSLSSKVKVLVVVEGLHDIRFLCRLSRILRADDAELPDLECWQQDGRLVFVPTAGGDLSAWATRFASFGVPEFHLYDREVPPDTAARERAVALVNRRPVCRAVLTAKRSLENYLHCDAIQEARGVRLTFDDQTDVADLAARHCYDSRPPDVPWHELTPRARKRLRERAKHWLNCYAAACMTPQRIAQRDSADEIRGWLRTIAELASRPL
jgi:hypothetical protein